MTLIANMHGRRAVVEVSRELSGMEEAGLPGSFCPNWDQQLGH